MIGPNAGEMAEAGEAGVGRMSEAVEIAAAAIDILRPPRPRPLAGKRVLITAGPTHEAIDPVRYIANRSSGKQGFAIAAAAQAAGADVTLVSGPVELRDPAGVTVIRWNRRVTCCTAWRRHCRPTSRSSPPPWPTGASPMRASRS